jgi:hypothetical protein
VRCGAGDAALIVFVVQKADLRAKRFCRSWSMRKETGASRYGNSIHHPPTIGAAMISLPA